MCATHIVRCFVLVCPFCIFVDHHFQTWPARDLCKQPIFQLFCGRCNGFWPRTTVKMFSLLLRWKIALHRIDNDWPISEPNRFPFDNNPLNHSRPSIFGRQPDLTTREQTSKKSNQIRTTKLFQIIWRCNLLLKRRTLNRTAIGHSVLATCCYLTAHISVSISRALWLEIRADKCELLAKCSAINCSRDLHDTEHLHKLRSQETWFI